MVNGTSALLVSWVLFQRGSVVKGSRSNTHLKRNTKVWGTWAGRPAGRGVREACPRCPWGRQWPGRVQTWRLPRAGHASFSSLLGLVRSPGCLKVGVNSILMRSRSRGHVALGNPRGKFTGRGYGGRGISSPLCRRWAQGGFRQLLVQLPPQAGADGGSGGGGSPLPRWTVTDPPPSHGVQGCALRLGVSVTCPVTAVGRLDSVLPKISTFLFLFFFL